MNSQNPTATANGIRHGHEKTLADLNKVVEQAEALLQTLGEEGSEAVETVRKRVMRAIGEARSRIADSRETVRDAAVSAARRGDEYVHENPWKSVAIAAGVGAVVALLISTQMRREP